MAILSADTQTDIESRQIAAWRRMPPHLKLRQVEQMRETVLAFAMAGLRKRHAGETDAQLQRRLAGQLYGEELATAAYGPIRASEMPPTPVEVTLAIAAALERLEIPYAIGGSLGSATHGEARATMDVDIIAGLELQHLPGLIQALDEAFYADEAMIQGAIARRPSFNLLHLETMLNVDVFVAGSSRFHTEQPTHRQRIQIGETPKASAYVTTAEDIVLAKLALFRKGGEASERQWRDVLGVLSVQADRMDWDYLEKMAQDMEVRDLLVHARDQVTGAPD